MSHIAFDIGGTSMRVAALSAEGIEEVKKVPTPQDPSEGIVLLSELVKQCAGGEKIEAVAGGFPGSIMDGLVYDSPNLPKWGTYAFEAELSKALEGTTVSVCNDADLAGLGEAVFGAGKGKRIVAYIGVGTGVGGGRIVERKIDTGAYGLEPGHQIVNVEGLKDLESYVSGRAFEKRFGVHPKDAPQSGYEEMTPVLAVGLYNTILHWSPDILVLGGSMIVGVNGYHLDGIKEALQKISTRLPVMPEITMAKCKDAAGLQGARTLLFS